MVAVIPSFIQTRSYSFLDRGALYLTEEMRTASWIDIRVSVDSFKNSPYLSYLRNPPQGSFGYATGVHAEAVVFEKQIRFDYESVYRQNRPEISIMAAMCVYYSSLVENLIRLHTALAGSLPFLPVGVAGITPFVALPLDSIRVALNESGQFTIDVFWVPSPTPPGPCSVQFGDVPDPSPVQAVAPSPGAGGASSPGAEPVIGTGVPVGPLSKFPSDSFPGDYGDRNQVEPPLFWALRFTIQQNQNNCESRPSLAFGNPRTPVTQPNPYTVGPPRTEQPSSACPGVRRVGFFRSGVYIGDVFDVVGSPVVVQVPQDATT